MGVLRRELSLRRAVFVVPSAFVVEVERRAAGFASGVVASAAGALALAGLSADSDPAAGAALVFSAWAWARVEELLRRDVAGFVSCSWLTVVALSDFWRVVRLREVAGFTCSCVSGDSDVSFMKKTPFCILVSHID